MWEYACEIRIQDHVIAGRMRSVTSSSGTLQLLITSEDPDILPLHTISSSELASIKITHPHTLEITLSEFEDVVVSAKNELYFKLIQLHQHSLGSLTLALHQAHQFYAAKESNVFKIFNTQAESFQYFDELAEKDYMKVYTFESFTTGKRKFLVAHENAFLHRYIQQGKAKRRHVYEIIREDYPCRLYFDIEFYCEFNPHKNTQRLLHSLMSLISWKVYELFRIPIDASSFIDLESSTSSKFSRHISVIIFDEETGNEILFLSNRHVGNFVSRIVDDMVLDGDFRNLEDCTLFPECEDFFALNADGKRTSVIDLGVYTRNRSFRIFQSCKFGKTAVLKTAKSTVPGANKLLSLRSFAKRDEIYRPILRLSYVVPYNAHKVQSAWDPNALPYGIISENGKSYFVCPPSQFSSSHIKHQVNASGECSITRNVSSRFRETSPLPDLDAFVRGLMNRGGAQGELRSWSWNWHRIVYQVDKNRWCENVARSHKSNGIMMNADLRNGYVYQTCWDPDCRGFRSCPILIPPGLLPEWSEIERIYSHCVNAESLCQ